MAGMPARGRPTKPLTLTEDERAVLERWSRRGRTAQSLALRSKIVLGCANARRLSAPPRQAGGQHLALAA
jgi:hypothetical protein